MAAKPSLVSRQRSIEIKVNRLFTFGCSFTQYWRWPTWADCVGHGRDHYENWGMCGAGNCYIFYSLMECHRRNCLGPDDQVLIMWSNTSREDRYVKDRWLEGGNVYWGTELGEGYLRRFACERGYLIRDMAVIAATKDLLDTWGCDWRWFAMAPLDQTNSDNQLGENPSMPNGDDQDVHALYSEILERIAPSVLETVFGGSWFTGNGIADSHDGCRRDFHPTPAEHVRYLDAVAPDLITPAGRSWMQRCEDLARTGTLDWTQPNRVRIRL